MPAGWHYDDSIEPRRDVYAYVTNDPVDKTDPEGTDGQWFGYSATDLPQVADMGLAQAAQQHAALEAYPEEQAYLKANSAAYAGAAFIPVVGEIAEFASTVYDAAALIQEKEVTGKVSASDVGLTLLTSLPGAKALGDLSKIKHAVEAADVTQKAAGLVTSAVSAVSAILDARASTSSTPQAVFRLKRAVRRRGVLRYRVFRHRRRAPRSVRRGIRLASHNATDIEVGRQ